MADREPIGRANRPTGKMQSTPPVPATPHSGHDLVLLAAAVDRDADPALRAAAAEQEAGCAECAALAADLRSLVVGLADLPPSMPAPRDMRLTPEQAARLRRGNLWQRFLRPFGSDGLPILRPLAAALTTLGLAGILLTAIPLGSGTATLFTMGNPVPAASGAAVPAALSSAPAEQGGSDKGVVPQPQASASASGNPAVGPVPGENSDRATGSGALGLSGVLPRLSPLAWLSVGLVVVGLGLFALRLVARRVA